MYVSDKLIRHEINRINNIRNSNPDDVLKAKTKLEVMLDLEVIDYDQYSSECDILDRNNPI